MGTPGPEQTDDELTVPIKSLKADKYERDDDVLKYMEKPQDHASNENITMPEEPMPLASPNKSILLTPGTQAARRKTVSFGDGVVDNERRRTFFSDANKGLVLTGNISRQWPVSQSDGNKRARNKFTQSLIDAREKKTESGNDSDFDIPNKVEKRKPLVLNPPPVREAKRPDASTPSQPDETVDLDEPRSQSGVYWKSEYENYRNKTSREIKKLIQYRVAAKSYAKKKEAETVRLAEKLRLEEVKVHEMEGRVAKLAAGVIGNAKDGKPSDEAMLKELSQETALTVHYKQGLDYFKKAMEKHVIHEDEGQADDKDEQITRLSKKLQETEQVLEKANSYIEKHQSGSKDTKELQSLAESPHQKANDLEKENLALKKNLARYKEEMPKYEERRKTKEARLKQREAKLEARLQECRSHLKQSTQQHREAERLLKQAFDDEKEQLENVITSLQQRLTALGDFTRSHPAEVNLPSRRRVRRYGDDEQGGEPDESIEFGDSRQVIDEEAPPSPYEHHDKIPEQHDTGLLIEAAPEKPTLTRNKSKADSASRIHVDIHSPRHIRPRALSHRTVLSPRPSMVYISHSPPKPIYSSPGKEPIPPERLAAAKARLRRKQQDLGKLSQNGDFFGAV